MRRVEGTGGDLAHDLAERLAFDRAEAEIGGLAGTPDASKWLRLAEEAGAHEMRYHELYAHWRAAEAHLAGVAGRSSAARRAAAAELALARSLAEGLAAAPLLADIEALVAQARLDFGPFDMTAASARSGSGAADRNGGHRHDDDHGDLGHRHDDDHDGLGLTSRELEVLRLVADGRSNAQIGRTLFISTKTASVHVSNILRKLEVTNRVEAGTVARHQWHD